MCWNPEVSISTYLFSAIPVTLCYIYGLMPLSRFLYLQSFISIQLVEYFLWTYLENDQWNRIFSIIGWSLIFLQPMFSILSIQQFDSYKYTAMFAYLIYIAFVLFAYKTEFKTVVATNKHLQWKWLDYPSYIIFTWLFFFCFRMFFTHNYVTYFDLIITLFTFTMSYYYFQESKAWGSMWCWVANIIGFCYYYTLFMFLYQNRKVKYTNLFTDVVK